MTKERGNNRIEAKYIPIHNGKFEYELNCDYLESYSLAFYDEIIGGGWRSIKFFSDADIISFNLHPKEQHHLNSVKRGKLNKEYEHY